MSNENDFYGPGGTRYELVHKCAHGRVGVARLRVNEFRVRIEPTKGVRLEELEGSNWNQPEGSNWRYSKIVEQGNKSDAINEALEALDCVSTVGAPAQAVSVEAAAQAVEVLQAQFGSLAAQIRALKG